AILWHKNRKKYRGWYVLHRKGADRLYSATRFWFANLTPKMFEAWSEFIALFLLHEIIWRWTTCLQPLFDAVVFEILEPQMKRFAEWRSQQSTTGTIYTVNGDAGESVRLSLADLDEAYLALLRERLRHAREVGDDVRFESIASDLQQLGAFAPNGPLNSAQSYLRHQQVLLAMGRLQHTKARDLLETWDTSAGDAIWAASRARL